MPAGTFADHREFSNTHPENHLVIENYPERVTIRAAQNNFSRQQKISLIRYLAAEGYIPLHYQWFADSESKFHSRIEWINDACLPVAQKPPLQALRRIVCLILCASFFWLALMSFAYRQAPPRLQVRTAQLNTRSVEIGGNHSDH